MKWPRTTAIMAAALLSLAGCSNPVERGAPSSGDENPRGNTGDTPSSGESAEPGTPNGGSGDRFADYLPELGPSPTWHEGADFFDPCEDVPHHIYEQAGFTEVTSIETFADGHFRCEMRTERAPESELGVLSINTMSITPDDYQSMIDKDFLVEPLEIGSQFTPVIVVENLPEPSSCKLGFETVEGTIYFSYFNGTFSRNQLCEKATDFYINLIQ